MGPKTLATSLRKRLETTIGEARQVAEAGAKDAIRRLGVADPVAPTWANQSQQLLRRRLRAHARSLGDGVDKGTDRQDVGHLKAACAYAHWHRMLFARFLAERGLLRHPVHDVAVSLADCADLAAEEGLVDAWAVAERYAATMLPAVFQPDDAVLALQLAPESTQKLQALVMGLDRETFIASDSLGWTYQFWRGAEKEAINNSGMRIGADELPAVTQLFTEPYMVRFLLHNTLGAWWAGKVLASQPGLASAADNEGTLREACALSGVAWDMLRFVREEGSWRPAAGTFPGWPNEAKAITLLDPCCGSGHFLTEALPILVALRRAEERLSPAVAVTSVLRDNLFGLEIDGRCVQIAAFAVALSAWAIGGWQTLPRPHIAWVGAPPPLPRHDFVALANGDEDLRKGLGALHDLFSQAPLIGSLIEPTSGDLTSPQRLGRIEPLLNRLLEKARQAEPEMAEGAIAARGMADAALILTGQYVLLATNVPYIGNRKQGQALKNFIENNFSDGKADLAAAMQLRCEKLLSQGGTFCIVTKHELLFQKSYEAIRRGLIREDRLNMFVSIGEDGFESSAAAGAFVTMLILQSYRGGFISTCSCIDAFNVKSPTDIEIYIRDSEVTKIIQADQLKNQFCRIILKSVDNSAKKLSDYCETYQGIKSGDDFRFIRNFWEVFNLTPEWLFLQSTVLSNRFYGGANSVIWWGKDGKHLVRRREEGQEAAKHMPGVSVGQMRDLPSSILVASAFDSNVSPILVKDEKNMPAVFSYCTSADYVEQVRLLQPSIRASNTALIEVPFDLLHWQSVAADKYATGLPEPYTEDPTQWLFHGHPAHADAGAALHVALARLAGYRWPAENTPAMRLSSEARKWIANAAALSHADDDGILCIPAVAGSRALADRLRTFLTAAFGTAWSDALERQLIAESDEWLDKNSAKDQSIESWLRRRAFRQHCKLFHDRPFLWQIWDGLSDGFSAFLNCHHLNRATLEKLTWTLLNDWIARMKIEGRDLHAERARLLQQKLDLILKGEPPYDIFVRWKSLEHLPMGWEPDFNDGVRINIRPFAEAGILVAQPNIKWTNDRGTDVVSAPWHERFAGKRINDHHTTLAEKRAARAAATARVHGAVSA